MDEGKLKFARLLLSVGALEVRPGKPFLYASGLRGPIYCDNRKILSFPNQRKAIIRGFRELISQHSFYFDHIAGLATGGIAPAALLSDGLERSMLYIRPRPKGHGRGNQIEGAYHPREKLLLVEDLVNQGSSLNSALLAVQRACLQARGCLCIVDYQMEKAHTLLRKWNLPLASLTDFNHICLAVEEEGKVSQDELELLRKWNKDPKSWSRYL